MDIFIKWNNDQNSIQLPILPEGFEQSGSMNNTSVNISNFGEINLKGKRSLYSLPISSFFPRQYMDIQHGEWNDPYDYYIANLKALYESNTTVHVIITGTDISMFCTIESFTYGENEKNGDVSYSLEFKEFRETSSTGKVKRPTKSVKTTSRTWKKGDTWQSITKSILGSSKTWKTQRKNNNGVIKKAMKKHPKTKEAVALIGSKVVIKA